MRRRLLAVLFFGASAVALVFLVLPVVAIFTRVPPGRLLHLLSSPVVTDALVVSFKATAIAQGLILVFGTPAAYLLATRRFRGRTLLVTLVELPLVLPRPSPESACWRPSGASACWARPSASWGSTSPSRRRRSSWRS